MTNVNCPCGLEMMAYTCLNVRIDGCRNRKSSKKNEMFIANPDFAYYCMSENDELIQGHYCKIEICDNSQQQ